MDNFDLAGDGGRPVQLTQRGVEGLDLGLELVLLGLRPTLVSEGQLVIGSAVGLLLAGSRGSQQAPLMAQNQGAREIRWNGVGGEHSTPL